MGPRGRDREKQRGTEIHTLREGQERKRESERGKARERESERERERVKERETTDEQEKDALTHISIRHYSFMIHDLTTIIPIIILSDPEIQYVCVCASMDECPIDTSQQQIACAYNQLCSAAHEKALNRRAIMKVSSQMPTTLQSRCRTQILPIDG